VTGLGSWLEVRPGLLRKVGSPVDVNCVLVMGSERAMLVDTGSTGADGRELAGEVHELSGARPLAVVNTHAHYDHCFGNAAFSPGQIWASSGCIRALANDGVAQRQSAVTEWREKDPEFAAAIAEACIVVPGNRVESEVTIDLGNLTARLISLGRGHTDHDLVIWLPSFRTVIAGDLVEESGPPALEDAFPLTWHAKLSQILTWSPDLVIPGHGQPVPVGFVREQQKELQALARFCAAALEGGPQATRLEGPMEWCLAEWNVAVARARLEVAGWVADGSERHSG